MILPNMMTMIESHAEELTNEVLSDLRRNPRTPYFHRIPPEEMRRRIYDVYHNLGHWLAEKNEANIEAAYNELGRRRRAEVVPLSEVVCAVLLTKGHLWDFIRRNHDMHSAMAVYQQEELISMIGRFFDKAIYHTVKGHEGTQASSASAASSGG
jgi:hypothetical protein